MYWRVTDTQTMRKLKNTKKGEHLKLKIMKCWGELKDLILLLLLLSLLVGVLRDGVSWTSRKVVIQNSAVQAEENKKEELPKSESPVDKKIAEFSAYTKGDGFTPSDTMASGKKVYVGAVANNCLEFGTKIKMNNIVYTVEDRMAKRFDCSYYSDINLEYNYFINAYVKKRLHPNKRTH